MSETPPKQQVDEVSLIDYLEILIRRRKLIVGLSVLSVLVGLSIEQGSRVYDPGWSYQVVATLELGDVREIDSETGVILRKKPEIPGFLESPGVKTRLLSLAVPVVRGDSTGSVGLWEFLAHSKPFYQAVEAFDEFIEVRGGDGVVTISVTLSDSVVAEVVAAATTDEFIAHISQIGREEARRDEEYLDGRISELESELRIANDSLSVARERHSSALNLGIPVYGAPRLARSMWWWGERALEIQEDLHARLLTQRGLLGLSDPPRPQAIYFARSRVATRLIFPMWKRAAGSVLVGLFGSIVFAFLVEWVASVRAEGRWAGVVEAWRNESRDDSSKM
jgi:hypothetical protein